MGRVSPALLSLEDAQARLLALATPLPIEHVDIEGAVGRYLAEPLHARRTQPATALSAMDGYAVSDRDLTGPWRIVGESAAGHPHTGKIGSGEAARISTGAALPPGATSVIVQEDVERREDFLTLTGEPPSPADKHVRPAGMDFVQGAPILAPGTAIGPAQAAIAIAGGHRHLPVHRLPRVSIVDSGDELAVDPECCAPHQIPASNGAMLMAMARPLTADVHRLGPVPDRLDAITSALEASSQADLVVTSGGASVGDHDLIRPALERWGAQIDFWRVAIKPGKPILVATREHAGHRQIVLGLPGNPVSSYVTAYLFMLPLLRRMLGANQPLPMQMTAPLGMPLAANGQRREFLRAWWDGELVMANPLQDSGALSSLAASNVLIDRPAFARPADTGDEARIFLLQNGGIV